MKTIRNITAVVIVFLSCSFSFSQTVYTFSDGLKAAKSSGKKIFIDIYSLNDKWSNKMNSEIYTLPEVQSAISGFIFVRINAEGSEKIPFQGKEYTSSEIAKVFGSTGYPTFVFLNPDGTVIKFKYNGEEENNLSGFLAAEDFIELLEFFSQDKHKTTDLSVIFQ